MMYFEMAWASPRGRWHVVGERVSDGVLVIVCNGYRTIDPDEIWEYFSPPLKADLWCLHCLRIVGDDA